MAYYLAERSALGRTAELLGLPWIKLRERFRRLDVPIHLGLNSLEEAYQELNSLIKAFYVRRKLMTDPLRKIDTPKNLGHTSSFCGKFTTRA